MPEAVAAHLNHDEGVMPLVLRVGMEIPRDLLDGVPPMKELQDVDDGDARPRDTRLPEMHLGIDCHGLGHGSDLLSRFPEMMNKGVNMRHTADGPQPTIARIASASGRSIRPFSVTMPATKSAGVTSKAGQ